MSRVDLPGYGTARTPDYPKTAPCVICGADYVELNELCECAECAPRGEETCEAWQARVAPRRKKSCACTARFDAEGAYASGYCKAHGVAWHVRADAPFTVMATIHGPAGWFDVVDTKAGETVAVCPRRRFARQIATVLAKETGK